MDTVLNEGVKIVCDKILEQPEVTDQNSVASWEARRWIRIADYIIENDFGTFREDEVEAVKNAIREARRKYFTANVLDQVMWDTDPKQDESTNYGHPPIPRTKKEIEHERMQYEAQVEAQRKKKEMEYEYHIKQGARSQYQGTSGLGIGNAVNSVLGGY